MFQTFAQRFTQLDFLGARYYDNVNDGFDGNNNATDSLCVPRSPRPCSASWRVSPCCRGTARRPGRG